MPAVRAADVWNGQNGGGQTAKIRAVAVIEYIIFCRLTVSFARFAGKKSGERCFATFSSDDAASRTNFVVEGENKAVNFLFITVI